MDNGSLYPALQRLLQRGWLSAQWKVSPNGRRAKYYRLTPARPQTTGGRKFQVAAVRGSHEPRAESGGVTCGNGGADSAPGPRDGPAWLTILPKNSRATWKCKGRTRSPEQARREFGNVTLIAERARDAWGFPTFESLWKDVRYGLRAMRRAPAFSLVVILTFALGVGVNTAIFSVVTPGFAQASALSRVRPAGAFRRRHRPRRGHQRHLGQLPELAIGQPHLRGNGRVPVHRPDAHRSRRTANHYGPHGHRALLCPARHAPAARPPLRRRR